MQVNARHFLGVAARLMALALALAAIVVWATDGLDAHGRLGYLLMASSCAISAGYGVAVRLRR
jgi:hypothetical protein